MSCGPYVLIFLCYTILSFILFFLYWVLKVCVYIYMCVYVCVAHILVLIWLAFKLCVWYFCIKNWVKHCKNISLCFAVCRRCHAWSLVVVWSLSCVWLLVTPWIAARQASLSFISQSLLKHVHWVGDTIQSSHPLLSTSLPTFYLSQHQGLFQWVSSLHQVARVLEL